MAGLYDNSIFFVDINKVGPNPYQPRREFDESKLKDLAESIRQYGILQPLVVTRVEITKEDGLEVNYELIAGERRLRASKIAELTQVPVIIRVGDSQKMKLELAIIENLQREDLNPMERAQAFLQLANEFSLTHAQIGERVGKSREYVSNTMRLLTLPEEMRSAINNKEISEGHARPLLMLSDRKEDQQILFQDILTKKISVRAAERYSRQVAFDRARKVPPGPEMVELEEKLKETLGTRVKIEPKKAGGGCVTIDFFSADDIKNFLELINKNQNSVKEEVKEEIQNEAIENFSI